MNLVTKVGRGQPLGRLKTTQPVAFLSRGSTGTGVGHLCHLLWEAGYQVGTVVPLAPSQASLFQLAFA